MIAYCKSSYAAIFCFALIFLCVVIGAMPLVLAQSTTEPERERPSLSGVWAYTSITPLQRPAELGDQREYSFAELSALERTYWESGTQRQSDVSGAERHRDYGFAAARVAMINGEARTSLVIAPPDGRIPYRKAEQEQLDQLDQPDRQEVSTQHSRDALGPESFTANERCLSPPAQLPLLAPDSRQSLDERTVHIVQTASHIVMSQPAYGVHRIIKLAGAQLPYEGGSWLGDSVASWDADSLVVNTTGFRAEQSSTLIPASGTLQIYERFMPITENELLYTYTVWDPHTYREPFTIEMPLQRRAERDLPMQRACHEENLTLPAALQSARQRDVLAH